MPRTVESIVRTRTRTADPVGAGQGRSGRGAVLAAFAAAGLPDALVPEVIEVLETGDVAEEVVGAAQALRGRAVPPPRIAASLQRAIDNRAGVDTVVRLGDQPPTTVLSELVRALGLLAGDDPVAVDVLDDLDGERDRWSPDVRSLIASVRSGPRTPEAGPHAA